MDFLKDCINDIKAGELDRFKNNYEEIKKIVNYFDDTGRTMLHWASFQGCKDAVSLLLNAGANALLVSEIDENFQSIHFAAVNNHIDCIQILLNYGVSIESCDMFRRSLLSISCFYGRINTSVFLLSKGANFDHRDMNGNTVLHFAAMSDNADLCQILIYSGVDIRIPNDLGETAFHLACCKGSLRLIKSCLAVNPSLLNQTDNKGLTGVSHAKFNGNTKIHSFLIEKIKKSSRILPNLRKKYLIYGSGGSKYPITFLVVSIFFWAFPTYLTKILYITYSDWPILNCVFIVIWFGFMVSLYAVNSISPGFLPRFTKEYDVVLKGVSSTGSSESDILVTLSRLCHTCRIVKPLRAAHCSICRRCVRHKDHHCPYVYNCIGFGNRQYFLLFLICLWILMTLGFSFAGIMYFQLGYHFLIHEYFGLCLSALFYVFVTLILGSTMFGVLSNLTTNESLKWHTYGYDYLRDGRGRLRNPFNKGVVLNFLEYFKIIVLFKKRENVSLDI